ncbi:hypothetical protein GF336_07365 [Candidatus Woesearchaeota archaeon]|nr:hypothetical protein [Candidatus Woesearchaeota archaeon]
MSSLKEVKDLNDHELNDMMGNLLQLLIDTKKGKIYHVPAGLNHEQAAAVHLGFSISEVNKLDQKNIGHLVSTHIEIKEREVDAVVFGNSSLENGHNIKHTTKQKAISQKLIEDLIKRSKKLGEVRVVEDLKKHEFFVR